VDWHEGEVRRLERRLEGDPGAVGSVVFQGSSSIRLWDTLAADLGEPRIRNLGFGGSTLAACARYFERLVVPCRPGALVVYVGDNDLAIGRTPAEVDASFADLIRQVDARLGPIRFAFVSIKPSPALWAKVDAIRSANEMIRARIASRPNSDYVDVFAPMLGPDGLPRPELYAGDGLHLSRAGYRLWAEVILSDRPSLGFGPPR